MPHKKILIAEDHPLIVMGLKQIIKTICNDAQITVIDSCESFMNSISNVKPQYCIIDLNLIDGIAFSCIENMLRLYPSTNVLVYTTFPGAIYAKRLFKIGIHGFLNKNESEQEVKIALTKFLSDEFYISSDFLRLMFAINKPIEDPKINRFDLLSPKELIVIEYLRSGMTIKMIAENMATKANTTATYKKRAFQKLEIENIVQLNHLYETNEINKM